MGKGDIIHKKIGSVEYFESSLLKKTGLVKHFFSTKNGGTSSGEYKGLNLGVYTNDDPENVKANMKMIFNTLNMNYENTVYLKQIHSNNYFVVDSANCSLIKDREGDAIISTNKNIPIGVFTADCVPILILDRRNKFAAAVHAGWKGTFSKITNRVINYMINDLGTKPCDLIAAIGPSIGPCCFEVGKEVAECFSTSEMRCGAFYADLWAENKNQILKLGIPEENIDSSNLCSVCNSEYFYSYRRDKGKTGRMGSFIEII